MPIKRINIDKETLELMKKHDKPLRENPRSITHFEMALSSIVKNLDKMSDSYIDIGEENSRRIDGLIKYDIIDDRHSFVRECLGRCIESLLPELERSIAKEIEEKKRMYGLGE